MNINNYNSKEENKEFEGLKNLLNEIPKVNAPDNFEYNLMTKIQNGSFDSKKYKEDSIGWSWIYAPATALVFSVFLIFFVFNGNSDDSSNPLMVDPPLRASITSDTMIAPVKNIAANNLQKGSFENEESFMVVLNEKDVVVKEKLDFPFNNDGLKLDDYSGNSVNSLKNAAVVGNRKSNYFDFNGFFIRVRPDETKKLQGKARVDSVGKNQDLKDIK